VFTPPHVTNAVETSAHWVRDTANPRSISNIHVETTDGYAFAIMGYFSPERPPQSPAAFTLADILGVSTQAFDDMGRSGAGLWLGTWANVSRIKGTANNMGVWTGCNFSNSSITEFGAYGSHVGMYCEHVTSNVVFRHFDIKGDTQNSVNIEWTYNGEGSSQLTFEGGSIYCPAGACGIFADAGTWGCKIGFEETVTFYGPGDGMGLPNHLSGPTDNAIGPKCVFKNGGKPYYKHDNMPTLEDPRKVTVQKPEELHPHTIRREPWTIEEWLGFSEKLPESA
jgi:hypothetical protein